LFSSSKLKFYDTNSHFQNNNITFTFDDNSEIFNTDLKTSTSYFIDAKLGIGYGPVKIIAGYTSFTPNYVVNEKYQLKYLDNNSLKNVPIGSTKWFDNFTLGLNFTIDSSIWQ
jgi:hypothetical protein